MNKKESLKLSNNTHIHKREVGDVIKYVSLIAVIMYLL